MAKMTRMSVHGPGGFGDTVRRAAEEDTLLVAHTEVQRYVDSIRNARKRAYAAAYYGMVVRNGLPAPDRGGLSLMAAQAVEMRIRGIMHGAAEADHNCPVCDAAPMEPGELCSEHEPEHRASYDRE